MTLIDEEGHVKLDGLEELEKKVLVDAFLETDPLAMMWQVARIAVINHGYKPEKIISDLADGQSASFTLFFRLLEEGIAESDKVESREQWLAELSEELKKAKKLRRSRQKECSATAQKAQQG